MIRFLIVGTLSFIGMALASAAQEVTVTAKHGLAEARPGEVIAVPFAEVAKRLPGAQIFHLKATHMQTGADVPLQMTNYEHDHKGFAADDLVFQHDFAAGEREATFRIERVERIMPPVPPQVFARFVPERYDDFAWENDRIAHRMYGPALDTAAAGREKLRSSGIDIWVKRVRYPVIDRWYLKGHDGFHQDDGEGLDPYSIGPSRGVGGSGIWDGKKLHTSGNFMAWRVLANGPLRAVFELDYAPWDAGGMKVAETKRFIIDAGRNLHRVDSTFTFEGPQELTVGLGMTQSPQVKGSLRRDARAGLMMYWQELKAGGVGSAVILAPGQGPAEAADEPFGSAGVHGNALILVKVKSGQPLHYYIGAGWDRSGDFADRDAWEAYVTAFAARLASPVEISLAPRASPALSQ